MPLWPGPADPGPRDQLFLAQLTAPPALSCRRLLGLILESSPRTFPGCLTPMLDFGHGIAEPYPIASDVVVMPFVLAATEGSAAIKMCLLTQS